MSNPSVPPPPVPKKFVSKLGVQPSSSAGGDTATLVPRDVSPVQSSQSVGQPPYSRSTVPTPGTSIMKKSPTAPGATRPPLLDGTPAPLAHGVVPASLAAAPSGSVPTDALKLRILVEELLRENKHLQRRVATLLGNGLSEAAAAAWESRKADVGVAAGRTVASISSSPSGEVEHVDMFRTADPVGEVFNESTPPPLLLARIRRLELALQLESVERDDLETKFGVQQRLIALLLKKVNTGVALSSSPGSAS